MHTWRTCDIPPPLPPCSSLCRGEAMELLRRWFVESKGTVNVSPPSSSLSLSLSPSLPLSLSPSLSLSASPSPSPSLPPSVPPSLRPSLPPSLSLSSLLPSFVFHSLPFTILFPPSHSCSSLSISPPPPPPPTHTLFIIVFFLSSSPSPSTSLPPSLPPSPRPISGIKMRW